MFKKRKCKNCNEKISDKYEFCPHCGNSFNENSEDWGMLGKTDSINEFEQFSNSLFGGGMLGKMLGRTMKMLEKELQKEMQNKGNTTRTNFELIINGKRIDPKDIKISQPRQIVKKPRKILPNISNESLKKISKIPKKEPLTNIRRLTDRVIYEIIMPGVNSVNDISVIKLESSIEIKALAGKKAYFKVIPINLPIINYQFLNEKLVLEFGVGN